MSAYSIQEGSVSQDMSSARIMRGRTRFDITVQHKDIEGTHFGEHYFTLIETSRDKVHDIVDPGLPLKHICDYCLPVVEQLAPQTSFKGLTLEDLLHSPLYTLEIVRTDPSGNTQVVSGGSPSYSPALYILPLKTVDLSPGSDTITRIAASQISIEDRDHSIGVQGKLAAPDGRYMYFKPREEAREKHFDRELRILHAIKQKRLATGETRLSGLHGIVVSGENEEKCVGVLINMIATASYGPDLMSPGCWEQGELHEKWKQQVTATVEVLQAHEIVWGDVNAGNVVIDEASNAWVIDFGGSNNSEFVDDDKAETVEGDWQGVTRLFQVWLPDRRAGVPW